jgi:hypothetical protein
MKGTAFIVTLLLLCETDEKGVPRGRQVGKLLAFSQGHWSGRVTGLKNPPKIGGWIDTISTVSIG